MTIQKYYTSIYVCIWRSSKILVQTLKPFKLKVELDSRRITILR